MKRSMIAAVVIVAACGGKPTPASTPAPPPEPAPTPDDEVADDEPPDLTREQIDRTIKDNRDAILACYRRELPHDESLAGKVTMSFVIAADGAVSDVTIEKSTTFSEPFDACLIEQFGQLRFPASTRGGRVRYPLIFSRG